MYSTQHRGLIIQISIVPAGNNNSPSFPCTNLGTFSIKGFALCFTTKKGFRIQIDRKCWTEPHSKEMVQAGPISSHLFLCASSCAAAAAVACGARFRMIMGSRYAQLVAVLGRRRAAAVVQGETKIKTYYSGQNGSNRWGSLPVPLNECKICSPVEHGGGQASLGSFRGRFAFFNFIFWLVRHREESDSVSGEVARKAGKKTLSHDCSV